MAEAYTTLETRAQAIDQKFHRLSVLNLARMILLEDFENGFITVEELFGDPPDAYLHAAIKAKHQS